MRFKWKVLCLLMSVSIMLFIPTIASAQPMQSTEQIQAQIRNLEAQMELLHLTATYAREGGATEEGELIINCKENWNLYNEERLELLIQLQASLEAEAKPVLKPTNNELEQAGFEAIPVGTFRLTGYCPCYSCSVGWGTQTASGNRAQEGITIAADKSVLPLGTKVYIEGVGERIVQDVGGAIKGNKIDVYVNSHNSCYRPQYNQDAQVWILP